MKSKDNKTCETHLEIGTMNPKKARTVKCPKCGAMMREKTGRYGPFLGCSNYPRCKETRNVTATDNLTPMKRMKPTRRRAGLQVILPEKMNYTFRQRAPGPHQLKIYRQEEAEATDVLNDIPEFTEADQDWMTLEDYCLERDLLLDHRQLIKEGKAISRYHRTHCVPGPHKLPHDNYGTVNGYRRCSLDRWYQEFMARY
jgi:ssDNA-binding Zn-finger/Zn-ribbon topoisomerase 1